MILELLKSYKNKWIVYSKLKRNRGKIVQHKNNIFQLHKTSRIDIENTLELNANNQVSNGRTSILRMDEESVILVNQFSFMYGADIILFKGAKLKLGKNSFINSNCKIRCHKEIEIGNNCAISHDFTVMDSNAHKLNGVVKIAPVHVGNHVWVGTRVTILPGVTIGDGAVIAAGAVVTNDVPPSTLVGGVPARVIKENVNWEV